MPNSAIFQNNVFQSNIFHTDNTIIFLRSMGLDQVSLLYSIYFINDIIKSYTELTSMNEVLVRLRGN